MDDVDFTLVKRLFPHANGEYLAAFADGKAVLDHYNINNQQRVCHFLAQIGAETGGLRVFEESLNYSAVRLTQVWPRHFPTIDAAEPYAHNEEALGNFIYGPKVHPDLGNTQPGDGFRYRGRGLLQITGRYAYKKLGDLVNVPLVDNPKLVFDHRYSLAIAAAEFSMSKYKGVNTLLICDKDDLKGVTYAVNGGQNGIDERRLWLARAKQVSAGSAEASLVADAVALTDSASRAVANADRMALA